ncbi:MAG: type II toxin-antitoxin system RelE/ParE family toxin [Candidatus Sulfotelmatobacter sp.]
MREIRDYVAKDKPDAAARLATRIVSLVEALKEHPYLGRVGTKPEVRELIVGGTSYLIFYRVRSNRVTVATIWQGAQSRRRRGKAP